VFTATPNSGSSVPRCGCDYFFLPIDCFANVACCLAFLNWSALACFCDDCFCTAFGDLSPIIGLPFVCGLAGWRNDWFLRLQGIMPDSVRYVNNRPNRPERNRNALEGRETTATVRVTIFGPCSIVCGMKVTANRAKRTRQPSPRPDWRTEWEPIFRAAEEGRLPNRLGGVLEMMMCQCALRKYRTTNRTKYRKS